ncbi:MraY family glycosyltransferase [Maribacter sp. CXY002]|uniref:MraY family glycosyltransferase n=1 Tax=Maribacter luteocoastalis TaxID=3407671 RepID=UPI003B681159
MSHIIDLLVTKHLFALTCVVVTFLFSYRMYPVIIYISQKKRLMERPGERDSHVTETPSLGGIGLFFSFSLALILFGIMSELDQSNLNKLLSVLGATLILLFLGIKDDLIVLAPKQKFIGQLVSSCMVIFMTDIRIENFNGILGIYDLPYMVSVIFTLFVFILVINAYNLIDGIDGLAGFLGIIASSAFGIFFLLNDHRLFMLVSFILIGSIISFLKYNLSDDDKLFMGDSGSLFVGYLLAYQGICFLGINATSTMPFNFTNAPVLLLAILSFPLLDTLRVFAIRIKAKRSPFTADRNHIHHRLLDIGCTHKQSTLVISMANVLVIVMALLLDGVEIHLQLILVIVIGVLVYLSPFMISLKPNNIELTEKSISYALSVDLNELNNQVKFRNRLIDEKNKNKSNIIDGESIIIMEGSDSKKGKSVTLLKDAMEKRAWILRNFSSTKSRSVEDVNN